MAKVVTAQGDRQCICNVRRFGNVLETKLEFDRQLNLMFRGAAIARHHFLDPCGFKMDDVQARLSGGQTDHSSRVSHQDRGARSFVVREELLERHQLRLE